jgi:hypothetical protein
MGAQSGAPSLAAPNTGTAAQWADDINAQQGFQPSVEVGTGYTPSDAQQTASGEDVGAPLDVIGILDWAEPTPADTVDPNTPAPGGTAYGATNGWQTTEGQITEERPVGVQPAEEPAMGITESSAIVASPLPAPDDVAPDDTTEGQTGLARAPVPLPGSRDDAAFDAARIGALLNGMETDAPAPLAHDCAAWASITQAAPNSASVLIEITCLAGESVYLQLGDNAPETLVLDGYGAAQVVVGTTGAIHPMTLRRTRDGALLAQQDDPDLPPTVYAP